MDKLHDITLDKKIRKPLYVQLYNKIKEKIKNNSLQNNTKLPSIRELSDLLNVNSSTIVNAYKLLEEEDYIYKKIGSGTYVKKINSFNREDDNKLSLNIAYDFTNITSNSNLFPIKDFKKLMNRVIDRDGGVAFDYQDSIGYLPLRKAIMNYLEEFNIRTTLESIQIISGAQQGIDIISKTLIDYGDTVITESPTYSGSLYSFKSRTAKILEIPVDRSGIDIIKLEQKIKTFKPKLIYVMPNYQNPTGFSYSQDVKKSILKLADIYDTYIIEDDYISDIVFNNKRLASLKSMDKNNRVIYLKSFSKTFMPGIRLGFAILPISLQQKFLLGKQFSDIHTSGFIQRVFELFLSEGIWKKHIDNISEIYNNKYQLAKKYILKYKPIDLRYYIPSGGLNFWFSLPDGYSSRKLEDYLKEHKILISSGSRFYNDNQDTEYFRINIASIDIVNLEKGIIKLFELIKKFIRNDKNKILKYSLKDLGL
ncbi:PLP-dependent aminotransferase family protein [Clostridium sp. D2Q-14]|uniref:MocR-like pyridoxine biosynthesis transcription factor PdxR n=1 Tax=Anaeromonas gelatinilytica TaxID=2683194 RepID=UPI00193BA936|nr:PLP-dependent aminotransferase family protein [Anaeromonas gelatinilytica]MBS4536262.1 PLP-dependent aminotransferase family protein [Anaeromonas gelatinilytica]